MLTVGELKEFIEDMEDSIEVMVASVIIDEKEFLSSVDDVYRHKNYTTGAEFLILTPVEVAVG